MGFLNISGASSANFSYSNKVSSSNSKAQLDLSNNNGFGNNSSNSVSFNKYGGSSNSKTESLDLSLNKGNSLDTDYNISNSGDEEKLDFSFEKKHDGLNSSFNFSEHRESESSNLSMDKNGEKLNTGSFTSGSNENIGLNISDSTSNSASYNEKSLKSFDYGENILDSNKDKNNGASFSNFGGASFNSSMNQTNNGSSMNDSSNMGAYSFGLGEISPNGQETSEQSKSADVVSTGADNNLSDMNPELVNVDVDEYVKQLKSVGFTEQEISDILAGKVDVSELAAEIDSDPERKRQMLTLSYLNEFGLDYDNLDDILVYVDDLNKQKDALCSYEKDCVYNIIDKVRQGGDLNYILEHEHVWEYIDENGLKRCTFDDPYANEFDNQQYTYKAVSYKEMCGDSEYIKQLKSLLTLSKESNHEFFLWNNSIELQDFLDKFYNDYGSFSKDRDSKIKELSSEAVRLTQIHDYIDFEVNYYMEYVDTYIHRDDYLENSEFDTSLVDRLGDIKQDIYNRCTLNGTEDVDGDSVIGYVSDDQLIDVISGMINCDDTLTDGYFNVDGNEILLYSDDTLLEHMCKWAPIMDDTEKRIFNYIYNTEGKDAAYKYLKDISEELDNRWLFVQTQRDQEFADEHPVLASIGSVVITPFEGMAAAFNSYNALLNGEDIFRSDVYSAGDVFRGEVAQNIAEAHGNGWSFIYSTGLSMADTAVLIGVSYITGGTSTICNMALSAVTMGSRAYVSTLNDALYRGLSDEQAVLLATSSSIIETAMESYSVGHLFNLEEKLGKSVATNAARIAGSIENEQVANIVTKGYYVVAGAISQALAEGEEEFCTEVVNYVADVFIAKDLSLLSTSIEHYLSIGYSEEDAYKTTFKEFFRQALEAFAGGFFSGLCFGSFSSVKTTKAISQSSITKVISQFEGENKATSFAKVANADYLAQNSNIFDFNDIQNLNSSQNNGENNNDISQEYTGYFDGITDYYSNAGNIVSEAEYDFYDDYMDDFEFLNESSLQRDSVSLNENISIHEKSEMLNSLLGEELSSWILDEQTGARMYDSLVEACSRANISIYSDSIKKSLNTLKIMQHYYDDAKNLLRPKIQIEDSFNTYRSHGIVHILDVFTQTINAYSVFKQTGTKDMDFDTMLLAAVMHDTGMSGGKQIVLYEEDYNDASEEERIAWENSLTDKEKEKYIKNNSFTPKILKIAIMDEVQMSGLNIRESHSFNSADIILKESKNLINNGMYNKEQVAEAALLAFAHSKSNSGLKNLGSTVGWSFAIDALQTSQIGNDSQHGEYFDLISTLKEMNVIIGEKVGLKQMVSAKSPKNYILDNDGKFIEDTPVKDELVYKTDSKSGGSRKGLYESYDISSSWIERLSYESLALRLGDALTNNDNARINQYGELIEILKDYDMQLSISDVVATESIKNKINDYLSKLDENKKNAFDVTSTKSIMEFMKSKDAFLSMALEESKNVVYKINGKDIKTDGSKTDGDGSQPFVEGEDNQTYRIEKRGKDAVIVVDIKDTNKLPFCTLFAIQERYGEIITKGDKIFNPNIPGGFDNVGNLVLEINVDANANETIKNLYKEYASQFSIPGNGVIVQVSEKIDKDSVYSDGITDYYSNAGNIVSEAEYDFYDDYMDDFYDDKFDYLETENSVQFVDFDERTKKLIMDNNSLFISGTEKHLLSDIAKKRNDSISQTEEFKKLVEIVSSKGYLLGEYGGLKISNGTISPDYQALADSIAQEKYSISSLAEPAITSTIKSLESENRYLVGLDFRLKGSDSLSRKIIADSMNDNITLQEAADLISDCVRYTMICGEYTMASDIKHCLFKLQDKGYEILKFKNIDTPVYKGINTSLISPNGTRLELQFHTEKSFSIKEETNHLFYEISRNKGVTSEEESYLANKIMEMSTSTIDFGDEVRCLKLESVKKIDK